MNTITSKRTRHDLYMTKLCETTLFIQNILQQLASKERKKHHKEITYRELCVAIRNERFYHFEAALLAKYKYIGKVVNLACESYVELANIKPENVRRYDEKTYVADPVRHIFTQYLKKAYVNSRILQEDDDVGSVHDIMESMWPEIIKSAIELKLDIGEFSQLDVNDHAPPEDPPSEDPPAEIKPRNVKTIIIR